jgi:hypothetical protein
MAGYLTVTRVDIEEQDDRRPVSLPMAPG